jgi:glucose-6-phosphate 1-dehydrogenase
MIPLSHPESMAIVIFGASGDLAQRKILPALYNLFLDQGLPEFFTVIGLGRTSFDEASFRQYIRQGLDKFSRRGKTNDQDWNNFSSHLTYISAHYNEPETYSNLAHYLSQLDRMWHAHANHTFYLATPPEGFEVIAQNLGKAGLSHDPQRTRIIIEKPFGRDLMSARALNQLLRSFFQESQIYRIDHYLGKETVQNILAFRFANALFEPIWDRRYIDHVQISVSEEIGVEHRGGYYDRSGALRDMLQNHLLQLLCLIAMETPVSFNDNEIRNKKVDVLHALRPIPNDRVHQFVVRGQYGGGWIRGQYVAAYREEPGVASNSTTETFVALKFYVDNWRWQDVPFYLRTGKRLPAKASEVSIQFRPVPHRSFPPTAVKDWQPNRIDIHIQPEEGILLRLQAKQPGLVVSLRPVDMRFTYREAFQTPSPEAYETLLLDGMVGDATLYMRTDEVEAAWSILVPILEVWEEVKPKDFPNYPAGTWGPESAKTLIAQDGRSWRTPSSILENR